MLVSALTAGVALVAYGAVTSQAAKTHDVDATITAAKVKGLQGCRDIFAAYVTGKPTGKAAGTVWLQKDTCTTTTTLMRIYGKRGALQVKGFLGPETEQNGDISYEGEAKARGISGRYDDSTGVLTVKGTYDSGTGVLTLRVKGEVQD